MCGVVVFFPRYFIYAYTICYGCFVRFIAEKMCISNRKRSNEIPVVFTLTNRDSGETESVRLCLYARGFLLNVKKKITLVVADHKINITYIQFDVRDVTF